jgi:hypothetical protein
MYRPNKASLYHLIICTLTAQPCKRRNHMSHHAQKTKSKTPPRPYTQNFQSAPIPANSSELIRPSAISEFAETIPAQEAPTFLAGPGASTFQPPISLAQLAANNKAAPIPTWPIQDLLPEGLCLLAAKPHAGLHTLALQLALSITSGTEALEYFKASSGEVLYLGFHDTQHTILTRTQNLLGDEALPSQLSWSNTWQDWQQDGLAALNDWLDEHPRTRLLVIDSFSHLLPPGTSTRHAYQLLHQLNHLAHTHHLCILLLHSLARTSAKDPFSSIPCSPLLLETCETLAVLEHDRGTVQATLHLTSHTLSTRALSLSRESTTDRWSLDASSTPASHTTEPPPEIPTFLEMLAQYTPRSLRDLASDEDLVVTTYMHESSVTLPTPPPSQADADPLPASGNAQ